MSLKYGQATTNASAAAWPLAVFLVLDRFLLYVVRRDVHLVRHLVAIDTNLKITSEHARCRVYLSTSYMIVYAFKSKSKNYASNL